jgi:tripartite ATP-independent transporter DctM subunit
MAGVVPGLLLTAMFMAYIFVIALIRPEIAPKMPWPTLAQFLKALSDVVPFVLLVVFVLGSIYAGLATPTEAAALGCIAVLVICKLFGSMNWRIFDESLHSTVVVCGNIMFIVLAAYLFSYAISYAGIGESITLWVIGLKLNQIEFFLAVFVLYTILGCLVESVGMIVITVPLLFPLLPQFGIDPVWFGIILVVFVELGQISPPIGINLYVVQAMWNGKLSDVVMGTMPFHIIMLVLLFMLVAWPQLALWLPSRMIN